MTQLSISEAREKLTKLANQLNGEHDAIEVTSHGKPVLAILSWDLYEALEETVEILGNEEIQSQLKGSIRDMKQGKLIPWSEVKKRLK
jgi:prevent-host-death family protein